MAGNGTKFPLQRRGATEAKPHGPADSGRHLSSAHTPLELTLLVEDACRHQAEEQAGGGQPQQQQQPAFSLRPARTAGGTPAAEEGHLQVQRADFSVWRQENSPSEVCNRWETLLCFHGNKQDAVPNV